MGKMKELYYDLKELQKAYDNHDRATCKVDCCIFCYMVDTKIKEEEKKE